MFDRTYYATHPDMMACVSNDELRDRYLIRNLFRPNECVLNYTHADRLVIGGVLVERGSVRLPDHSEPASAAGHPFLERSEEHTSELQSLMRISYAVFCLKKKKQN